MRRMRSGFKHCAIPIDICRWEYILSPLILQDLQGPQQGGSVAVDVTVRCSVRFVHLPHYGGFNHGTVQRRVDPDDCRILRQLHIVLSLRLCLIDRDRL
ncbi:surface protein [Frog virus 3]|uniref:Uncharacterized protein 029L n=2 Tax=Frog virus 3 TaxID=10493 RepID=029L_FRG3G|nr:hypothetical protein FV3gorf29L [Frog virus 3]Q6GZU7.1 RecName: Full=Uncharacterized protein 029L [Frog virus 3 (isolate Goorha)]ASU44174.1 hypothetical protein RCV-Z2_ORF46 [Rana catesbeiana virus 2]QYJ57772.1 hypothetical protein [Stickleback virus]QYJ57867.1 hypothetical protein [Tadpole virus 2]WBG67492.1 hypothetical protein [Terrapene mexicana triunguis ranavirus 1]AAT09688.1 unknown [Frog virus 3]